MLLDTLTSQSAWLSRIFGFVLVQMGDLRVTVGTLAKLLLLVTLLVWFAGAMQRWLVRHMPQRWHVDEGTRIAIASVLRYLVLVLGMVLILQNVGIKLSALGVVAGAVGVGVGFGLQNIVSNFISGLIVMLERPIKVGDRVEVGAVEGVVREISARRTTIVTADNIAVLIPNQRFIVENVSNAASLGEPVRLRLSAGVPPATDRAALLQLWRQVASAHAKVLAEPAPALLLRNPGGSPQWELTAWYWPESTSREQLSSELAAAFAEHVPRLEAAHG